MLEMPRALRDRAARWRSAEIMTAIMLHGVFVVTATWWAVDHLAWHRGICLSPVAAVLLAGAGVVVLLLGLHQTVRSFLVPRLRGWALRTALVDVERLVARQAERHDIFHSWIDVGPGAIAVGVDELMLCDASTGYAIQALGPLALVRLQYRTGRDRLRIRLFYRRPDDGRTVSTDLVFRHLGSAERFLAAIRHMVEPRAGRRAR